MADIAGIKEYANEILAEIVSLKVNKGYGVEEFAELINLCL